MRNINKILQTYYETMSLKIHFFYLYPGLFPANLGAVSDEQGERFHQVLKIFGDIHKGFWDAGILEDYS